MSLLHEVNQPLPSAQNAPPSSGAPATGRNVTVVLRTAGERTTDACYALLARQVPAADIVMIRETPFARAVQRTFELGIERRQPWTLAIDADVLVRSDAVAFLLRLAAESNDATFEVQGMVLDKLMGGPRAAGNHLFRTALLPLALSHIQTDAAMASLRPETFVMRRMAESGHPWVQHDLVLGLHDYEQNYRDIYRTAFVHAHKHNRQLPYIMALWERFAEQDIDYRVALWGAQDGLAHQEAMRIDTRHFSDTILLERMQAAGLSDKTVLDPIAPAIAGLDQLIHNFEPPPEYWLWQHLGQVSGPGWPQRMIALSQHVSWPTILAWLLRGGMRHLRRRLESYGQS